VDHEPYFLTPINGGFKKFFNFLQDFGFNYEVLSEMHKISAEHILSDSERKILDKTELIRFLPKKWRTLSPCPFLELSADFSDVYICKASDTIYMPVSNLSEKEIVK